MKKFNLLMIAMIFMFVGIINVKADNYAFCYYNYTPNDSDFKVSKGLYKDGATLVVQIAYHEKDYPTPQLAARLIFTSDSNFTDGYSKEFSNDIPWESLDCLASNTTCFLDLPKINVKQLKDNSGKLVCPSIYLFKENHKDAYGNSKPNYQLALSPDTRNSYGDKYDSYQKIDYDPKFSKITNSSTSSSSNQQEVATCNYNYVGYYSAGQMYTSSGTIGFSILKDGKVSGIFATGNLSNDKLQYAGDGIISSKKCPGYIKLTKVIKLTNEYIEISEGTGASTDAVYNGDVSNADQNANPSTTVTSYVEITNSSNQIVIDKVGGNYNIYLKNGSVENAITISNITNSNIQSSLESGNYPKYVVHHSGGSYEFQMEKPQSMNGIDKMYINSSAKLGIEIGKEEVYDTCSDLFGDSFLNWLDENVFMLVRIAVPIILIVLTSFDFAKVVFNDDKDGMPNALRRFYKRAIAAVLIFLTPTIILTISGLIKAGSSDKSITSMEQCVDWFNKRNES